MTTDTAARIIAYIREKKQATPHELRQFLGISGAAVHKQLKKLLEKKYITKIGVPPKVFYTLPTKMMDVWLHDAVQKPVVVPEEDRRFIDDRYVYITPTGKQLFGFEGFAAWCVKTQQPIKKTAREYIATCAKYDVYRRHGFIDGLKKFQDTFDQVYLDEIFYLDFYSIERFGKTKLGQMLLYAKQTQNKELIRSVINEIRPRIQECISRYEIDAVGFIPPTVKRSVQFMTECASGLHLQLPQLSLTKINGEVAVPQKTLSRLEDRIQNAEHSIFVTEQKVFRNILIIDDAIGSGATLNETAKKIREQGTCSGKIIGLAITGSFKGFEVLNEV